MGPLFESLLKPLLKSGLQPLARYGTCQENISRRHERMYLHLTLRWPGKGPLFESESNKRRGNGATIRVTSEAIIEVKPAALGWIWHLPGNHKWET